MNKIVEGLKKIYKDHRDIFSIHLLVCWFVGLLYAFLRGLRYRHDVEVTMAEHISTKVGFDFHPDWVSTLLALIGYFLIFLLFITSGYFSLSDIFNLKKRNRVNSENSSLYKKKSNKKKKKRK